MNSAASFSSPSGLSQRFGSRFDTARLALVAFGVVEAVALVLFLKYGDSQWFWFDEWDFLADRNPRDVDDLLRPHNEHWSTLPILVYRVLWRLFGLRTYVPYQVTLIVLHLTAAALLRTVMRRAGVGPWIATAAASLFALLGAAHGNILWAFQIGFVGSLVFGLVHLLLADHDGPIEGRDWLGLLAGLAALMCSGIGVTMVAVVGVATLIRRGWRVAVLHTAPLAALYAMWWLAFARDDYAQADPSIGLIVRFVTTGLGAGFDAMGQVPGAGVALGVVLIGGLVLAWRRLDRAEIRQRAAAPCALLAGAVMFLAIAGVGRAAAFGPDFARSGRYLHLVAAFSLPALAVAADAVARRWRALTPVMLVLLVIGVPGNLDTLADSEPPRGVLATRDLVLTLPRLSLAAEVPRSVRPMALVEVGSAKVTIGWLLDGLESGRIPAPGDVDPRTVADATFRLSIDQTFDRATHSECRELAEPVQRRLEKGESLVIRDGPVRVVNLTEGPGPPIGLTFAPLLGQTLVALTGPLTVSLAPADSSLSVKLCS